MKRIVFLCAHNSCRSQMAEGWARHFFGTRVEVLSAGTQPSTVDPLAVEVMAEVGVDISAQCSKSIETLHGIAIDHAFTLCDAARDQCPLPPNGATLEHRGFDDPASLVDAKENRAAALQHYRRVRDEIGAWVEALSEKVVAHV